MPKPFKQPIAPLCWLFQLATLKSVERDLKVLGWCLQEIKETRKSGGNPARHHFLHSEFVRLKVKFWHKTLQPEQANRCSLTWVCAEPLIMGWGTPPGDKTETPLCGNCHKNKNSAHAQNCERPLHLIRNATSLHMELRCLGYGAVSHNATSLDKKPWIWSHLGIYGGAVGGGGEEHLTPFHFAVQ